MRRKKRGRQVSGWGSAQIIGLATGALVGMGITFMVPVQTGPEMYKFFLAGMVAIIAMILPGISGSFLLVIMGKYQQVFTAVHARQVDILASFCAGCVVGVLLFSRLLKALLARHHGSTMAFLVGLMLGSLRKVWPFRQVLEQRLLGHQVIIIRDQCVLPGDLSRTTLLSLALLVLGAVLVLVLERLSRRP